LLSREALINGKERRKKKGRWTTKLTLLLDEKILGGDTCRRQKWQKKENGTKKEGRKSLFDHLKKKESRVLGPMVGDANSLLLRGRTDKDGK